MFISLIPFHNIFFILFLFYTFFRATKWTNVMKAKRKLEACGYLVCLWVKLVLWHSLCLCVLQWPTIYLKSLIFLPWNLLILLTGLHVDYF